MKKVLGVTTALLLTACSPVMAEPVLMTSYNPYGAAICNSHESATELDRLIDLGDEAGIKALIDLRRCLTDAPGAIYRVEHPEQLVSRATTAVGYGRVVSIYVFPRSLFHLEVGE